jgi:hypothetical protein
VNNKWLLAMQEGYSITDRNYPHHDTRNRHSFIALAYDTDVVRQVIAFDVAKHNIVASALMKCFLKDRKIGVM